MNMNMNIDSILDKCGDKIKFINTYMSTILSIIDKFKFLKTDINNLTEEFKLKLIFITIFIYIITIFIYKYCDYFDTNIRDNLKVQGVIYIYLIHLMNKLKLKL